MSGVVSKERLLSILILTHNRKAEVSHLIRVLENYLQDSQEVEVIVSDNSDEPLELEFNSPLFRTIRPSIRYKTAEEHLFYAIKEVEGSYVWPLGDDDVPTKEGIEALIELCRKGEWDAMTWNARNVGVNSEVISWSRVFCRREILELQYSDFITRMGFWSIPAGLSLTVFRRELMTDQIIQQIEANESPIYSHVVAFALAFRDAKFAFLNKDLVHYRTNSHDAKRDGNHWNGYADARGHYYRYPWTLGFIKHLKLLESEGAISKDYLARAIDISHFGSRFVLLDVVTNLFLEQLIMDITHQTKLPMNKVQIQEVVEYLELVDPPASEIWKLASSAPEMISKSRYERSKFAAKLHLIRESVKDNQAHFPFQRFYRGAIDGNLIYDTPLGWLSYPPNIARGKLPKLDDYLGAALQGIEFPSGYSESSESRESVESKIDLNSNVDGDNLDWQDFFTVGETYMSWRRVLSRKLVLYFFLPRVLRDLAKKVYVRARRGIRPRRST